MKNSIKISLLFLILLFGLSSCQDKYEKKQGKIYFKWLHGGDWTMHETLLSNADASTFQVIKTDLNLCLAKEKYHVFVDATILEFADPNTFQQVKAYYWKDKNYVFLLGVDFGTNDYRVQHADPKSFEPMKNFPWSKDKDHVYYYVERLDEVKNPGGFIDIDKDWGKDGKYYYHNSSKIDSIDYNSAQVVSSDYVKDKKHVFYHNKLVKDANPQFFKADGAGFFGHDDKYMFDEEKNTGPITEEYRNK